MILQNIRVFPHFCTDCSNPCHAIYPCCVTSNENEKGFGADVLCKKCSLGPSMLC